METQDRRNHLGGSDISAIFGLSPWKTALDLYEEKIAPEFIAPEIEPEREKRLRRGKFLEPLVVKLVEEEQNINIFRRNQVYTDPERPYFGCEIDFEFMGPLGHCNGDVKTISPFAAAEWGEEGTDEIPLAYALQFHWGLMITGRSATLVAAMIGADDLRCYEVRRDDDLITEIRKRAIIFWEDHVRAQVPPPPQNAKDANRILAWSGGFISKGSEEVWQSLEALKGIKERIKGLEAAKETAEGVVKRALAIEAQALGVTAQPKRHTILGANGKPVATYNQQHRDGYTVQPTDYYVLRAK